MITISIDTLSASTRQPFNKLFFNNEQEAFAWFNKQRNNLLNAFGVKTPEEVFHILKEWPDGMSLPASGCSEPDELTGWNCYTQTAIDAFLRGTLVVHQMAVCIINGESFTLAAANDLHKTFSKIKKEIQDLVLAKLKTKVAVTEVLLDGSEIPYLYLEEQFLSDKDEMSLLLNHIDLVRDCCEVVQRGIKASAFERIYNRLSRAEEALLTLKRAMGKL